MLLLLLGGCSSPCLDCPEGDPVDLTEAWEVMDAIFGGSSSGTAVDDGSADREGVHYEPCALDGMDFTLEMEVG